MALRPVDAALDAPPNPAGCADRTREGFVDMNTYPAIAACAGAWSLPGLRDVTAACGYKAGNDGELISGVGCSAADLCDPGWHVCQTNLDVAQSLPIADRTCNGLGAAAETFFATAQGGPGGDCAVTNNLNDDFVGCGTYGITAKSNCTPLDRTTNNMCSAFASIGGWNCPVYNDEVHTVTKSDPLMGGGVLCCRDL